ncbi:MAG: nitroreductase family protein [Nanoarchaeota archaeon]|nr:nitroreductase family protein [Nanoarchaeota archaeon]MBU1270276.1 nitroreductase family protein [Nanoarchaeota archaeon]MBU1604191.1 nitroreductase family protein [Nanoarchaeota archaeon]MBU2443146.1 nitroreductase family protein [Nanoarchaeota archaeon]
MDVVDAIRSRRSVRKYQDREVSKDVLLELIDAARLAPSGNNAQPWMFKIITSAKERKLLRKNKIFKQAFVYTAPAIILCCSDPYKYPGEKFDEQYDHPNKLRAIRDLAISSQNLVLRATELGLGTCYVGWMDKDKIKELFNLPLYFITPYVITVGYPAENPSEHKKKELKDILIK